MNTAEIAAVAYTAARAASAVNGAFLGDEFPPAWETLTPEQRQESITNAQSVLDTTQDQEYLIKWANGGLEGQPPRERGLGLTLTMVFESVVISLRNQP